MFGGILKGFREAAGVSQERLGELAGLHRTHVSHMERGTRNFSIEAVEAVLCALGVTWEEFGRAVDRSDPG